MASRLGALTKVRFRSMVSSGGASVRQPSTVSRLRIGVKSARNPRSAADQPSRRDCVSCADGSKLVRLSLALVAVGSRRPGHPFRQGSGCDSRVSSTRPACRRVAPLVRRLCWHTLGSEAAYGHGCVAESTSVRRSCRSAPRTLALAARPMPIDGFHEGSRQRTRTGHIVWTSVRWTRPTQSRWCGSPDR